MDQDSFEQGLLLGIMTAISHIHPMCEKRLRELYNDTERRIKIRRNGGVEDGRKMLESDIFTAPVASGADFGLQVREHDADRVKASKMVWDPPALAAGTRSAETSETSVPSELPGYSE